MTKVIGINAGHIHSQGPAGGVISHFVRSNALIDLLVDQGEPRPHPLTRVAIEEQQRHQAGESGWFAEPPQRDWDLRPSTASWDSSCRHFNRTPENWWDIGLLPRRGAGCAAEVLREG